MRMGIVDLSSHEGIDWSKTQPSGTYRCDRGWEAGGYQFGCLERATTDVQSEDIDSGTVYTEHLCTDHALIQSLTGIQNALQHGNESTCRVADDLAEQVSTVTEALWDIHYTLMPLHRRIWRRARIWMHNRKQCRPWETHDRPEPDCVTAPEMMPERELRGLDQ